MNAVGIDVSKGKSMVTILRPFGEIVSSPFEIKHINKDTAMFSVFRLIILPAAALVVGLGLGLDATSLGISVLMTGMPAGATAAIFAARYDSDALFATRCVVMTTLMSMLTLPVWCYLAG